MSRGQIVPRTNNTPSFLHMRTNSTLSLKRSLLKNKMLISIRFIIQAHLFNKFNNIHTQKCVSMTETT